MHCASISCSDLLYNKHRSRVACLCCVVHEIWLTLLVCSAEKKDFDGND